MVSAISKICLATILHSLPLFSIPKDQISGNSLSKIKQQEEFPKNQQEEFPKKILHALRVEEQVRHSEKSLLCIVYIHSLIF